LAPDDRFAQAQSKLREQYGFEIGESTMQRITLGHAKSIFEASRASAAFPEARSEQKYIVVQTDGGMIPVAEPGAGQKDKRKGKRVFWREAKICLAHVNGSQSPVFAGTIDGGAEVAGWQLFACAVWAGFGTNSHVHAVWDGAAWIVGQSGGTIWPAFDKTVPTPRVSSLRCNASKFLP
jgi:hypothetical protein